VFQRFEKVQAKLLQLWKSTQIYKEFDGCSRIFNASAYDRMIVHLLISNSKAARLIREGHEEVSNVGESHLAKVLHPGASVYVHVIHGRVTDLQVILTVQNSDTDAMQLLARPQYLRV
jgi:hypothetical protein